MYGNRMFIRFFFRYPQGGKARITYPLSLETSKCLASIFPAVTLQFACSSQQRVVALTTWQYGGPYQHLLRLLPGSLLLIETEA